MGVTVAAIIDDLVAEQDDLDSIVATLSDTQWELPTPSPRWAIHDQIGHLAFFDETAALAIADPAAFITHREEFVAAAFANAGASDELTLGLARSMSAEQLLSRWRRARSDLAEAAGGCADDSRIEWYGPSMGAKSFLTARLMECWAHGQDICDAAGAVRQPTDRLRHIAQLGFITRRWTYINRKAEMPPGDVHVALDAASGARWTWGPDTAEASVRGPAVDFCLVTAQRRNVADTKLVVTGDIADDWMAKAQLFAGPPSNPPPPIA